MPRHSRRLRILVSLSFALPLAAAWALMVPVAGQVRMATNPPPDSADHVRLVGYHDLQGRESLQVTTKSDAANGNWVYIGHSDEYPDGASGHFNPITKRTEWNGTSIVEISDPANPKLVWHIPNEISANSRSVSVVYDYGFNSSPAGRDYLIRSMHASDNSMMKFQVFDITARDSDPSKIALVSEILGTPLNSCGPGCGGPLTVRSHKGFWSNESGLFYAAAAEPGFQQAILLIFDLKDPRNPRFVGRAWLPGQRDGEPPMDPQLGRFHHPIVDEANKRVYGGYRHGSGDAVAWDITDPANPKLAWRVDTAPPGRGPHTVSPIRYDTVPNFGAKALPRTYAFVVDEASGGPDAMPCPEPVRTKTYMFDITDETHPFPVSTWQVPVGDFCQKGGRFGPHQSAETRNGQLNRFEDKIAWVAYFNAGVRVVDIADPYNLREVGHYMPRPNANSHPLIEGQPTAIQTNDVDIDHRGLAFISDRAGAGMHVLEYAGARRGGTD